MSLTHRMSKLSVLALAVLLVGCAAPAPPQPTVTPIPELLVLIDSLGREVELPKEVNRIVSLSPSNTEILFALGLDDQVVGVTKSCDYPEEAKEKVQIGGFSAKTMSVEKIVSLKADLVLSAGETHEPVIDELSKLGVTVFAVAPENAIEVPAAIETVGRITNKEKAAKDLVAGMRKRIEAVQSRVKDIPVEERPKVFWEVWDEPLMTAGPNTLVGSIIAVAGGVNIFADLTERYPQISAEAVVKRHPDVILAPETHGAGVTWEKLKERPGWDTLDAVNEGRVFTIEDGLVSRSSPRVVEGIEAVARVLHPALFN